MPLINPRANRVKTVRHICRLQEPNRDALVLYARFIGDSPDYVLNQLIQATILADPEFVAWRAEHPTEPIFSPRRRVDSSTSPTHHPSTEEARLQRARE